LKIGSVAASSIETIDLAGLSLSKYVRALLRPTFPHLQSSSACTLSGLLRPTKNESDQENAYEPTLLSNEIVCDCTESDYEELATEHQEPERLAVTVPVRVRKK